MSKQFTYSAGHFTPANKCTDPLTDQNRKTRFHPEDVFLADIIRKVTMARDLVFFKIQRPGRIRLSLVIVNSNFLTMIGDFLSAGCSPLYCSTSDKEMYRFIAIH